MFKQISSRSFENASSSSAAAAATSPAASSEAPKKSAFLSMQEEEAEWLGLTTMRPATVAQLHALAALPASMAMGRGAKKSGKGKSRRKGAKLAKEGQVVSKCFDSGASRPMPINGIGLEQSITMEFTIDLMSFMTSSTMAGIQTFGVLQFSLGQFGPASTVTAVFDQYRFEQIEVWIETNNVNAATSFPSVVSSVDLDDANTPTTVNQIQDKPGAMFTTGPAGHYHKWKPHVAIAAYSGAFTSYSNSEACWIDSASPNVQHYGIKAGTYSTGGAAATFSIAVRAVVSFRAPAIN